MVGPSRYDSLRVPPEKTDELRFTARELTSREVHSRSEPDRAQTQLTSPERSPAQLWERASELIDEHREVTDALQKAGRINGVERNWRLSQFDNRLHSELTVAENKAFNPTQHAQPEGLPPTEQRSPRTMADVIAFAEKEIENQREAVEANARAKEEQERAKEAKGRER